MDEDYTNVHRAFLQACGRFSVLNSRQAIGVLDAVQAKRKSLFVTFFSMNVWCVNR